MARRGIVGIGVVAWCALFAWACGAGSSGVGATPAPTPAPRSFLLATGKTLVREGGATRQRAWIDVYAIEADGRLIPAQPRVDLPTDNIAGVVADAPRGMMYVATRESSGLVLNAHEVDRSTGALRPLARSPLGPSTGALALHPNGRFFYAAARSVLIGYELDPRTGAALGQLPGSPYDWKSQARGALGLQSSPSGRVLWARGLVVYKSERIASFAIDPTSGAAAFTGDVDVIEPATNLAVDPQERFAWVVDNLLCWRGYSIEAQTGALLTFARPAFGGDLGAGRLLATRSGRWLLQNGERTLEIEADGRLREAGRFPPTGIAEPLEMGQMNGFVYIRGYRELAALSFDEQTGTPLLLQRIVLADDESLFAMTLVPAAP